MGHYKTALSTAGESIASSISESTVASSTTGKYSTALPTTGLYFVLCNYLLLTSVKT